MKYAGMMEVADVLDSKSSLGNRVQVRPPPQYRQRNAPFFHFETGGLPLENGAKG